MILTETPISGAYLIQPQKITDERGFFARVWCRNELHAHGLSAELAQSNVGFSDRKGTLRGLHFQSEPHAEVKIVRCTRGAIFDVIVDLRLGSPSFERWFGMELSAESGSMLYVPEGCAQGYVTLRDKTEMCYHASKFYHPESASGIRYDDPAFGIVWPGEITIVSSQDRSWPDYASRPSAGAATEEGVGA